MKTRQKNIKNKQMFIVGSFWFKTFQHISRLAHRNVEFSASTGTGRRVLNAPKRFQHFSTRPWLCPIMFQLLNLQAAVLSGSEGIEGKLWMSILQRILDSI